MTTPAIGSRWLDTRAKHPTAHAIGHTRKPANVAEKPAGEWRRIVKVISTYGGESTIWGYWQIRTDNGWETMSRRSTFASDAAFGSRYQPLEET